MSEPPLTRDETTDYAVMLARYEWWRNLCALVVAVFFIAYNLIDIFVMHHLPLVLDWLGALVGLVAVALTLRMLLGKSGRRGAELLRFDRKHRSRKP